MRRINFPEAGYLAVTVFWVSVLCHEKRDQETVQGAMVL